MDKFKEELEMIRNTTGINNFKWVWILYFFLFLLLLGNTYGIYRNSKLINKLVEVNNKVRKSQTICRDILGNIYVLDQSNYTKMSDKYLRLKKTDILINKENCGKI